MSSATVPSSHIFWPASRTSDIGSRSETSGRFERALLLQRRGEREEERRDQCEGGRHDTSLRCAAGRRQHGCGGMRGYAWPRALPLRRLPLVARRPRLGTSASTWRATSPARCSSTSSASSPRRRAPAGATRFRTRTTSRARRARPGSGRACSSSPTARSAGPSGSGGCCATSATTPARVIDLAALARAAHARRGARRAGDVRAARARPATRSALDELAARREELVVVDSRLALALARRGEPDRPRSRAGSRARSTRPGTSRCPSCRPASSSPTAAPASPRACRSTACTSPDATAASTRARGRSGSSATTCRASADDDCERFRALPRTLARPSSGSLAAAFPRCCSRSPRPPPRRPRARRRQQGDAAEGAASSWSARASAACTSARRRLGASQRWGTKLRPVPS